MKLRSKKLADWLGISSATIRLWARMNEYGEFLDPAARGGDGRRRLFDDKNARIIAHIERLKRDGANREEIMLTMRNLQADDWEGLPSMPQAPPQLGDVAMVPREAAESRIEAQRGALLREISNLQERVEELEDQLGDERDQHRADIERLLKESAEAQQALSAEIARLNREIGRLEGGRE